MSRQYKLVDKRTGEEKFVGRLPEAILRHN
jgi:hypothetical protein